MTSLTAPSQERWQQEEHVENVDEMDRRANCTLSETMTSLLSRIESSRSAADVETSSRRSTVPNVTTSSVRPVVLRNDVELEDPLNVVLGYIEAGTWVTASLRPRDRSTSRTSDSRGANLGSADLVRPGCGLSGSSYRGW